MKIKLGRFRAIPFPYRMTHVQHGPMTWPWWRLFSIKIVSPLGPKSRWYRIVWCYTRWGAYSVDLAWVDKDSVW